MSNAYGWLCEDAVKVSFEMVARSVPCRGTWQESHRNVDVNIASTEAPRRRAMRLETPVIAYKSRIWMFGRRCLLKHLLVWPCSGPACEYSEREKLYVLLDCKHQLTGWKQARQPDGRLGTSSVWINTGAIRGFSINNKTVICDANIY